MPRFLRFIPLALTGVGLPIYAVAVGPWPPALLERVTAARERELHRPAAGPTESYGSLPPMPYFSSL